MSEEKLRELQKRNRERLAEGLSRVERLEDTTDSRELEKWLAGEIRRYGGRRVEVDDAE